MKTITFRLILALLLTGSMAHTALAQRADPLKRLAVQLDLTDDQVARIQSDMGEAPGDGGWTLARSLHQVLSDEQRGALQETADRSRAYARGVRDGSRRDRGDRIRRDGPRSERRTAQKQDGRPAPRMKTAPNPDAMANALGLTADQRELLEIHRSLGAIRMAARARSGR